MLLCIQTIEDILWEIGKPEFQTLLPEAFICIKLSIDKTYKDSKAKYNACVSLLVPVWQSFGFQSN